MSINSMMKTYEIWENRQVTDKWGATTNDEIKVGEVEVAINYQTSVNMNNDNRWSEVTHIGLTRCKTLQERQILVLGNARYVIYLPPNNVSRLTQIYLKEARRGNG